MKELICNAFCDQVVVRKVPCGYAIGLPFSGVAGDHISFFIMPSGIVEGGYIIEDDGTNVPFLEAAGIDINTGTRSEQFNLFLSQYNVECDKDTMELRTGVITEDKVPFAALQFFAMLLRLQDFALLSPQTVRSTFKDDALTAIHETFSGKAEIIEQDSINDDLKDYTIDVILKDRNSIPLAVYLGTTELKALESLLFRMETEKYVNVPCKVVLIVETTEKYSSVQPKTLNRALNHLDKVLAFSGQKKEAMVTLEKIFFSRSLPLQ